MGMSELGRVTPTSGANGDARGSFVLDRADESLVVLNQLSVVIYGAWGRQPSASDWDFVVPGSAYMNVPIVGGSGRVELFADYPGAAPPGDVQAIVWRSSCPWAPSVGPIA